jgi:hypothetical protein
MAASSSLPLHLNDSRKLHARLEVSGLPWYIYNDHFDGYYRNTDADKSVLVFDVALNSSNSALMLGGVEILLPDDLVWDASQEKAENPIWINVAGIRAWHSSPDSTVAQIVGYLTSETSLSDMLRTVILDAEYCWATTIHNLPGHNDSTTRGLNDVGQECEIRVNVKSLIGADRRDGTYERCRDNILNGQGCFRISLKRNTEDVAEAKGGWTVATVEGLDLFDHITWKPRVTPTGTTS